MEGGIPMILEETKMQGPGTWIKDQVRASRPERPSGAEKMKGEDKEKM
jgi:hypothetical protein